MSELRSRFPDLLPMEEIRVGPETHTYEVIEYDDTPNAVKQQYVPNKAPVLKVEDVSGIVDGEEYTFDQGTDYEVTDTDNDGRLETIDFSVGGVSPDDNTEFTITYMARSIIVRYVESYEDEFDRLADDIENVIESHYVDEATNTGYIDNFEDQELVEYDITAGDDTNATVQSDVVLVDDWALELNSPSAGSPVTIVSDAGLRRYPVRGDTITYYVQLTNTDDIAHFDFMHSVNESGGSRFYRLTVDANAGEFTLQKNGGSVKSDTFSFNVDTYLGTWMRVDFSIEPIGDINASIIDNQGSELGSVSITDIEYTNGGIRFSSENANESSEVYFDSVDVVQRNSSDLDHIGAMFGELGKRRGRTDEEYSTFLRSIVQSFSGRGTVDGIKFAVASALDLPPDQIIIEEDFVENEYEVSIEVPFPPHELRTLTELADLADPSGVEFRTINYSVDVEEVSFADSIQIAEGNSISEDVQIDEMVAVNPNNTATSDAMSFDDAVAVNPNNTATSDAISVDDAVARQKTDRDQFQWEKDNWSFMQWTGILNIVTTSSDQLGSDETVTIDGNKVTASDTMFVSESVEVILNQIATTDTLYSDETVIVDGDTTSTSDTMSSNDTVTTTETFVGWDTNDWDVLEWVQEHN